MKKADVLTPVTPTAVETSQMRKIANTCSDFFKKLTDDELLKLFGDIKGLNKSTAQKLVIEKGSELQSSLFWKLKDVVGTMATYRTPQEIWNSIFRLCEDVPTGFKVYELNMSVGTYRGIVSHYLSLAPERNLLFHHGNKMVNNGSRWTKTLTDIVREDKCFEWLRNEVILNQATFHIPYHGFIYGHKDGSPHDNVVTISPSPIMKIENHCQVPSGRYELLITDRSECWPYLGRFGCENSFLVVPAKAEILANNLESCYEYFGSDRDEKKKAQK